LIIEPGAAPSIVFDGAVVLKKDLPIPRQRLVKFIPKRAFFSFIGSAS
jgi:hypothetical protein